MSDQLDHLEGTQSEPAWMTLQVMKETGMTWEQTRARLRTTPASTAAEEPTDGR